MEKKTIDPITFAVIKARIDGGITEMTDVILRTSRNPILYGAKDFSCSILTYNAKLMTLSNSQPIHCLCLGNSLPPVVECYKDDIHPGDAFCNNSPYHGDNHVGDFSMFTPIFWKGQLVAWGGSLCHWIDTGAYIPSNCDPLAKDVYEEAIHFPMIRIVKNYEPILEFVRFCKANIRYPEQWYGDWLAQIGSLWAAERVVHKLCEKYGAKVIKQFQDEFLDYGDHRMTEEISKLPKGTWSIEAQSEKVEPLAPDGLSLKVKMSIDPDEATITFDLSEMPDQLPWGLNLSESCTKGACVEASMPSFDPSLPRNDGVFRHFKFILREGAVAGIPKWPASTSSATVGTADEVANMVLNLWEQVEPGRGHAGTGILNAAQSSSGGTDFRRNNAPYGHMYFLTEPAGGASKGCDGWPAFEGGGTAGNIILESTELHELKVPNLIWEVGILTDSCGAGKWRGAPVTYQKIQPRHHTMTIVPFGVGHTRAPQGIDRGKPGATAKHWIEKHATREKTHELKGQGIAQIKEDEVWVALNAGGAGYGDPLERDPELVRDDARNYIISVKAARDEYGVILNIEPETYAVDYDATEKFRAKLRKEREVK